MPMTGKTLRPVRNNNPGNIRKTDIPWVGLAKPEEMTEEQQQEMEFCVFRSPLYGFRAMAKDLHTYFNKYGLHNVRGIVTKWAPPGENDTETYIKVVSDGMGTSADAFLNLNEERVLRDLTRVMTVHEDGGWFFDAEDLTAGVHMVFEPEPLVA